MPTRRQEIEAALEDAEMSFEDLRELFALPVHVLDEDLRHLERSVRAKGRRLRVEPARCLECGFRLDVKPGRFATPGRCPKCRSGHLAAQRLGIR